MERNNLYAYSEASRFLTFSSYYLPTGWCIAVTFGIIWLRDWVWKWIGNRFFGLGRKSLRICKVASACKVHG